MDHVELMAVGDGVDYLRKVLLGQVLVEPLLVLHDVVEHVPPVPELQNEVQLGLGVDHFIEAHDVGVLHELHAPHFLEKVAGGQRVQFGLVDNLHGHLFAREDVPGELHHREMAPAQGFVQVVQARDLAVVPSLEPCHAGPAAEGALRLSEAGLLIEECLVKIRKSCSGLPWTSAKQEEKQN